MHTLLQLLKADHEYTGLHHAIHATFVYVWKLPEYKVCLCMCVYNIYTLKKPLFYFHTFPALF